MIRNIFALLLFSGVLLVSCIKKKPVFDTMSGFIQGTTYSIVYDNSKKLDHLDVSRDVEKILHDFDQSLSLYVDSSIVSKMNRDEDIIADSFFIEVFRLSDSIFRETGGAFDVTVGPLVRAWGFGPDDHRNFKEEKRDSLMKLVGMAKVTLANGRLIKKVPGMVLDFNAIAQGYSVDVICSYFERKGVQNYLVEIGGEVRARGTKAGALWRIGIDRPEDLNMSPGQDLQAIIKITDQSVATSGNYRKFYVEDGVKYSHTIDPRTGYPAKNTLLSATILTQSCAVADGIATACMVMGKDSAIEYVKRNPNLSAYFIFSDDNGNFRTWMSESLWKNLTETE